ncbi:MAG TPA: hypothetical protein VGJ03_03705, partial [Acidimicrobiales bacterium]
MVVVSIAATTVASLGAFAQPPSADHLVMSTGDDTMVAAPNAANPPPGAARTSAGQYAIKAEMLTKQGRVSAATAVFAAGDGSTSSSFSSSSTTVPPSTSSSTDQTVPTTVPPVPPLVLPGPRYVSSRVTDYVALGGDQVVVVPDGTYSSGTVSAPHPATGGPYGGWLVLVAQDPGQVVVDMAAQDLVLAPATSRVLFVGFRFTNGRLFNQGSDIDYWYSDQTYPDYSLITSDADVPRFMFISGDRDGIYGSDFHDGNGSVLNLSNASDTMVQGVHIWNVFDHPGTDPQDHSHVNDISILHGAIDNLTVRDSYFTGNRDNHEAHDGNITGLVYDNDWYTGAAGTAFQFNSFDGRLISGSRTDVYSWDHA